MWRALGRFALQLTCTAAAALSLGGCVSPTGHINQIAAGGGLIREVIAGGSFDLVAFRSHLPGTGAELHVYIEGDGTPYASPYRLSKDPTPRNPVALELMVRDPAPALYLGRPCYLGLVNSRNCDPSLWTNKRFSAQVVDSLSEALNAQIAAHGIEHVTLIGHSGGAALALLVAQRVAAVDRVVTVAGNLDVAGWSALHGYAPLSGSLDPVTLSAPRAGLALYHLAGGADRNIPPRLIEGAARHLGGRVIVFPGFDHTCCWWKLWPAILETLPPAHASTVPAPVAH